MQVLVFTLASLSCAIDNAIGIHDVDTNGITQPEK